MDNTITNSDLLMSELEEFMLQSEIEELGITLSQDDEQFLIENDSTADFYIKLINKLNKQKEDINLFVDSEKERQEKMYENYRKDKLKPLDHQIEFYESALKTYAMNERAESGISSIKLPNGTLRIRKQQSKFEYDDSALVDYFQNSEQSDFIKTKYEVDKRALKKAGIVNSNNELVIDNQVVPGVTITPQEDKFEIK